MRGLVDGLDTPLPLLLALPGPYQEDYFTARFVGAFDDALAPVLCTLDSLAAYVDPDLAPGDFVNFVAAWVGTELDEQSSLAERRVAVRSAVTAYRRRGTVRGLTELAARVTGGDVDITESGGARWSTAPRSDLPGGPEVQVRIRVVVDDPDAVDLARLRAVLGEATPVHVPLVLEVVGR